MINNLPVQSKGSKFSKSSHHSSNNHYGSRKEDISENHVNYRDNTVLLKPEIWNNSSSEIKRRKGSNQSTTDSNVRFELNWERLQLQF